MASYLVSIELETSDKRFDIKDELRKLSSSVEITETCFAVESGDSAESIYKKVKGLLGENDILYVLTLAPGWFGRGPAEANRWLKKNVGD